MVQHSSAFHYVCFLEERMHIRGVDICYDAGISDVYPKFKPPPSSKKNFF